MTRIEAARRTIRVARYAIGAVVAAAFAGLGVAARVAHPGAHSHGTTAQAVSAGQLQPPQSFQEAEQSFQSGGASIAPSSPSVAPAVQSSGS